MTIPNDAAGAEAPGETAPATAGAAPDPRAPIAAPARDDRARAAVDGVVDPASQAGDAFVKRVVDGARVAIDRLANAPGSAVDRRASAFSRPSAQPSAAAGPPQEAWLDVVRATIRANPITVLAAALALGAIYAKLNAARPGSAHDPASGADPRQ